MKKITIAIDGYSSTGKSTVAKQLAKHLGYLYVDTGAMYRAITLYAMQQGYISSNDFNKNALINDLPNIKINFIFNDQLEFAEVYLNNVNVEKAIRTLEVSNFVSSVSALSEVRKKLVEQQKEMGKKKGIVMDGRDIGTVVFPDAELKLFMTASKEVRAKRRFDELVSKGEHVIYRKVLENVQKRDSDDTNRKDSPLVKANDAIEIDNSDLSRETQFNKILELVNQVISKS